MASSFSETIRKKGEGNEAGLQRKYCWYFLTKVLLVRSGSLSPLLTQLVLFLKSSVSCFYLLFYLASRHHSHTVILQLERLLLPGSCSKAPTRTPLVSCGHTLSHWSWFCALLLV